MQSIEKLSITIPRELAEKVREKVANGEYASQSDVVLAALRLWQEREDRKQRKRAALREKIDRALDDPSPPLDEEAAFACLEERFVLPYCPSGPSVGRGPCHFPCVVA